MIQPGSKFNKLTVLRFSGKKYSDGDKIYDCQCDCGEHVEARGYALRHSRKKQCPSCTKKQRTKHGKAYTKVYKLWARLKDRCGKEPEYLTVTYPEKWETFEGFWEDMGGTYFEGASIDRINNNGNYNKENCQWLTISEHARKSALERWRK